MDKLRAMQIFTRIVEAGSLTAAARDLDLSLPAVVRQLSALERALDARLLQRTTRRMSLTDEGREYYERARVVLVAAEEAELALASRRHAPRGRLRISAPVGFGRLHLQPLVTAFLARHPGVQIELLLFDRIVDLVEDGIDLAVRIAHMPDSSLVTRAVGSTRRIVVGSPALARRAGRPRTPDELALRPCIAFTGLGSSREWRFGADGTSIGVLVAPVFVTNQIDAAVEACLAGVGWGRFLCYQVRGALDDARLVHVLKDFEGLSIPVQIVYPHARLLSSAVRAFIDFVVPRLESRPIGAH